MARHRRTSIGSRHPPANKHQKRQWKKYKGQGKRHKGR